MLIIGMPQLCLLHDAKVVPELAPGPSVCTDGRRMRLRGSGGGTLRHVAYRRPKTWGCGVHDLDNNLIGYRNVESECFGFLIQQSSANNFPSDESRLLQKCPTGI